MKNWAQKLLIRYLVKNLFNTVTRKDVLHYEDDGVIIYKGQPLTREQKDKLIESAQRFEDSVIWQLLITEMKYQANRRMYEKAITVDDIMFGKAMLYTIDIMERRIKEIKDI